MLKQQILIPDTRPEYEFELVWDTDTPGAPMTCSQVRLLGTEVPNPQEVYSQVMDEMRMKNTAYNLIIEALPKEKYWKEALDSDGDSYDPPQFVVKDKHTPSFSIDRSNGSFTFTIPGLLDEDRNTLTTLLAQFGGRVTIG